MRRGTTPTHIFRFSFDLTNVSKVRIIYKQGEEIKLRKETSECTIAERCIKVRLTQEETFLFDEQNNVRIQLRLLCGSGDCLTSDIIMVSAKECLENEVL